MTLTTDTYHGIEANRAYVSHSQIKAWQQCPSRWHAEFIAGTYTRPESDALLIGSYVDMAITQPAEFAEWAESVGVLKKDGKPYSKFELADRMIAAVKASSLAISLLSGDSQRILTTTMHDVPVRMMADDLNRVANTMTDLKTTRDLDNTEWNTEAHERQHWITYWSYWQQVAFYQAIVELVEGWTPDPWIVAVDKGDPPRVGVYQMHGYGDADTMLDMAWNDIETALKAMASYRNIDTPPPAEARCNTCGYCRDTHVPAVMQYNTETGQWAKQEDN
jgi:hypothetical protein